jgi:hypothetical protein
MCRTVELVNQTTDAWRNEESKLVFITSLGLTPRRDFRGLPNLLVKLDRVKDFNVSHLQSQ